MIFLDNLSSHVLNFALRAVNYLFAKYQMAMARLIAIFSFIIMSFVTVQTASAQLGNSGFEDFTAPNFGNNLNTVSIAPWVLGAGNDPNVVRVDGQGGQDYIRGPEIDTANPGSGIDQHYLDIINGANDFYQSFTAPTCASQSMITYTVTGSFSSRADKNGDPEPADGSITIREGTGASGIVVSGPDLSVTNLLNRLTWTTLSGDFDLIPGDTYSYVVAMGNNTNFDEANLELVSICITAVDNDYTSTPFPASGGTTPSVFLDDDINGVVPTSSTVDVSLTNIGGLSGVTINPDGTINVPAGALAADYTLTYEICETGSATNCDTATVEITVAEAPAIDLVKTLASNVDEDGSGSISIGDTLNYNIVATNTGNVNQTNVVVSDALITPDTQTCASVAVGGTCTLNGTYVVTTADAGADFVNTASVVSNEVTTPVEDTATASVVPAIPSLSLSKPAPSNADEDGSGTVSVGDTLTYTVTATNTGNIDQNDVEITDPLTTPSAQICATVPVLGTCVLTGTYVVGADDAGEDIVNTAEVSSNEVPTPVPATQTTPVPAAPALDIVKTLSTNDDEDGSSSVSIGDTLTYEIVATNSGNIAQNNVVVSDALITPDTQTCASVAVGGTCTLNGTYVVTTADAGGDFVNTASVVSDEVPAPVEDTVTTLVVPAAPSFVMTKVADSEGPFTAGDTITYTYTVTNDGNVNINGVAITDTHNGSGPAPTPANETLLTDAAPAGDSSDAGTDGTWDILAPGDIVTFTGTYTVSAEDAENL